MESREEQGKEFLDFFRDWSFGVRFSNLVQMLASAIEKTKKEKESRQLTQTPMCTHMQGSDS